MSQQLISHNDDLTRLSAEGYDLEVRSDQYLLVKSVPYLDSRGEIKFGTLVSVLQLAGSDTVPPTDHVVHFIGEHPCGVDGAEIEQIKNASDTKDLIEGLSINHTFSAK